jgi:branched-chain amino acid transport system ATP-binding protein
VEFEVILQIKGLTKIFGALYAVDNVSFGIDRGELVALLGPNGAGKTTLFNLITGFIIPEAGKVMFKGEDITKLPPHSIAHKKIGLAFQVTKIFSRLTVFQNIQVALFVSKGKAKNLFSLAPKMMKEDTNEILEAVGLAQMAQNPADTLSQPDKKRLELGIALACRPELLLLDEPTSGQSAEETFSTMELVKRINQEQGLTLLFIEHKMAVVFGIARRIIVMHQGRIIADGKPEAVREDKEVQKAYLGERL